MTTDRLTRLLNRCKNQDLKAFRELVETHQEYAYALAYRMVFNREDAEDIVQETFLRVWRNLSRYDPERKFTTWLYPIVTNLCYDHLRSRARQNRNDFPVDSGNPGSSALDTNDDFLPILRQFVETLSAQQRVVFILRDFQNLSIFETAKVLDISEGTVKTNLYHARHALREKLKAWKIEI